MSRSRILGSFAGVFSATLLAAPLAVWFFPMTSPAQTVVDDPGITVDAGGTLLHRSPVHYPVGSRTAGTVSIEATLNSKGEVTDARVLSGPDELRRQALASVLDWHYSTSSGAPPRAQISIKFDLQAASAAALGSQTGGVISATPPAGRVGVKGGPSFSSNTMRVTSIEFSGISPEAEQELRNRLQIHEGDTITGADTARINQTVQEYDSHLRAGFTMRVAPNGGESEATLRIVVMPQANGSGPLAVAGGRSGGPTLRQTTPPPAPAPPSPGAAGVGTPTTIRVGGNVQNTKIISKATPVYPPLAKAAGIQGTVQLTVTVAADGMVQNIELISGHPLLVQAATDAVKQWVYQPTILNGNPVAVVTEVDVNFTLSQ